MDRCYTQRAQRRRLKDDNSYRYSIKDAYQAAIEEQNDEEIARVLAEGRASFYGRQSQMERIFKEAEDEAFREQVEADYLEEFEVDDSYIGTTDEEDE